jgi:hypothetical protein
MRGMWTAKAKQKSLSKTTSTKGKSRTTFFRYRRILQPTVSKNIYISLRHGRLPRFSWIYYGKQKSEIGKNVEIW